MSTVCSRPYRRACPLFAALTGVLVVIGAGAPPVEAQRDGALRVLLITGGGWHDYDAQKEILVRGLSARTDVEFTIDHEGGANADSRISLHASPDWPRTFDIVVYNICYSEVRDRAWAESIVRAHIVHRVPAVVLHCTMHSYNYQGDAPIWSMFVGVRTRRHQRQMPFTVTSLDPAHPLMARFPAPWRTPRGELYEIEEVYPTATPLAHAYGEDSGRDHVTVWTNRFAGVRVFGTTIGHHNETMQTPEYLDMVTAGLLWAAGRLERADGTGPGAADRGRNQQRGRRPHRFEPDRGEFNED